VKLSPLQEPVLYLFLVEFEIEEES